MSYLSDDLHDPAPARAVATLNPVARAADKVADVLNKIFGPYSGTAKEGYKLLKWSDLGMEIRMLSTDVNHDCNGITLATQAHVVGDETSTGQGCVIHQLSFSPDKAAVYSLVNQIIAPPVAWTIKWDTERTLLLSASAKMPKSRFSGELQVQAADAASNPMAAMMPGAMIVASGSAIFGAGISTLTWMRGRFLSLQHMHCLAKDLYAGIECKIPSDMMGAPSFMGKARLAITPSSFLEGSYADTGAATLSYMTTAVPTMTFVAEFTKSGTAPSEGQQPVEAPPGGAVSLLVEKKFLKSVLRFGTDSNLRIRGALEASISDSTRATFSAFYDPAKGKLQHGINIMIANMV